MNKYLTIIISDDDEGHTVLIKKSILRAGITDKILNFKNGQETLDFLFKKNTDINKNSYLLLLDIRMPKKGGMTVIKEAKEINPDIDILIVSAYISDDVVEEAMELGATDFVVKPIDLKNLLLKFETILEKRGQKVGGIKDENVGGNKGNKSRILFREDGINKFQQYFQRSLALNPLHWEKAALQVWAYFPDDEIVLGIVPENNGKLKSRVLKFLAKTESSGPAKVNGSTAKKHYP